jgi:hypothetical protein
VNAGAYAETLLPRSSRREPNTLVNLGSLYSLKFAGPFTIVLWLALDTVYFEVGSVPFQLYLPFAAAFLYSYFTISVAIWTYAYSIYSIWKIGRLPLSMKHFTEDRTLGLRPFGSASLRLTVAYVILCLVGSFDAAGLPLSVKLALFAAFALPGLGFFFVPLFGLHKKLTTLKKETMNWVSSEHGIILKEMQAPGGLGNSALATRLATVKSVREDVRMIREWPFDNEIIVRLVTLVLVPLVIALGAPFLVHYL